MEKGTWRESFVRSSESQTSEGSEGRRLLASGGSTWELFQTAPNAPPSAPRLPLMMMPDEPTARSAFVVQLLSSRCARASIRNAADAQIWMLSFQNVFQEVAELGLPAGLAYDVSFNKFGMRLCFLGISQNIASYAKRFCRRLVRHHERLAKVRAIDPSVTSMAVTDATRQSGVSTIRKGQIINAIRSSTPQQAAAEGVAFLASCQGAVCLAQGDLLPKEATDLTRDIKLVFGPAIDTGPNASEPAVPSLQSILYKPMWKPRSTICLIPGVPLICNACGRIPR